MIPLRLTRQAAGKSSLDRPEEIRQLRWSDRGITAYTSCGFLFRLEQDEAAMLNACIMQGIEDIMRFRKEREDARKGKIHTEAGQDGQPRSGVGDEVQSEHDAEASDKHRLRDGKQTEVATERAP